jgi:endoglucanase
MPRFPVVTLSFLLVLGLLLVAVGPLQAARLSSVSVLDKDYLMVHFLDGEVTFSATDQQTVTSYGTALSTTAAAQTGSWTLRSSDDANYGGVGQNPLSCHRKTKLSGHAQMEWSGSDYRYEYTYQHWIFLRLPSSLQQGKTYTLEIAPATNTDTTSQSFTFDIFSTRSEAVHVNLVGYTSDAPHRAADLYYWMGDGGARDYGSFEGNTVYLYNVATGATDNVGFVSYWKPDGSDVGGYDLTRSAVWNADFSGFANPGTYRLAVEGVGCSQDFDIGGDVYADPFKVSLRGFFYMRIGQTNAGGIQPPPRTPLYIPEVSPSSTRVYLTTMHPWHPEWTTFSSGDVWDRPDDWIPYRKPGNPTNPNAWGGHSDAADWDRHLGHVSIIYDMLLPYILTGGAIGDDDTGIAESGNGIPDLLDEARNEVDFWLRLRDGAGYSHGLTNPNGSDELFQAAPTAMAAWANAANCAMMAEAFRIAGLTSLMQTYRDEAITAYNYASGLPDQMLDTTQDFGYTTMRGRDLKMTAAAFLYDVTGDTAYESVVNSESVCSSGTAELEGGSRNQIWATAGYLFTNQPVHYQTLWNNMKASTIYQAQTKEVDPSETRPSRRATDERTGYFRTIQNVQRTLIAHAITTDPQEKDLFLEALTLEADWGLGRNPLNIIQMTTAWTPLESKRSVVNIYTSGRDDGVRGVHPGHTPYLNLDDWAPGMTMGRPSALYENSYPGSFKSTWPIAEGYFDSRWVWAHSEFTPQQTMRGKTALYGYLHGIAAAPLPTYALSVSKSGSGSGTVSSSPAGIDCGSDCSESYASGTSVTLTASATSGSTFAFWGGSCSGTGGCTVTMDAARSVTATFDLSAPTRTTYGNNGNPWAILSSGTTRIEAENYDLGGEGVAYHDTDAANQGGSMRTSEGVDLEATTDTGGGHNVGWIAAGEWIEFTVDVAAAGSYDLKLRVARQPSGSSTMRVLFAGVDKTGDLAVPSTGGWQTWTDLTRTGVSLSAGPQILRIAMVGGSFNVNWIEIAPASVSTHALSVSLSGTGSGTVTSSPAGIDCGSDCSESYASGTSVTLTASAMSGSTFVGWGGACSGTGGCTVTMDADRAVTATFDASVPAVTIYDDALASDWSNWSWSATVDLAGTSPVQVGSRAANVTYQGWGGLSLRKGTALSTAGYTSLKFWVHGGTGSNKSLRFYTQTADTSGESTSVPVTAVANTWTEITVPLSALGNPASIKRLNIQENTGSSQPMVTFDTIRLAP